MARRKLILICQSGGEFIEKDDGSLSYTGGEAHALDVNRETQFEDLKLELAEIWNSDIKTMSIKYFLPSNRRTLITVSNDKHLQRMIDFHEDSVTVDVYIVAKESSSRDVLNTRCSRASRTMVAESFNPTLAATTPADAATTLVVHTAPVVITPLAANAGLVDVNTAPATPTSAIAAAAPAPTEPITSPAGATSPTSVSAASTPASATPKNCFTTDDVEQQRRTASWKIGVNGPTIATVTDDVGQQARTASLSNDTNSPTTLASSEAVADDTGSWRNDNNNLTAIDVAEANVLHKLAAAWKNGITGVGQDFNNVHEFRDTLRKYAIAHRFAYKLKKNDFTRVSANCRAEGCSWRIHASWVPAARSFRIKKMNKSHTCEGDIEKSVHPTKNWLASIIKDKLIGTPHYKPKEIASEVCREFGIKLNYSQTWRGMEIAREELQGSYKEAYNQLPWFCEKVVETNPGSIATFTTKDDMSFQRLFVSFHASMYGFQNGCRPLLFLDATSLKSKYQEIFLAATAVDGDGGIFPVAFAIVDVENDDNWRWFLEQLKSVVSTAQSITFVSDKEKGLKKSVYEVFENSHHGYCIHHLLEDLKKNLKGPFHGEGKGSLPGNLLAAAHAPRLDGFRKYTEKMKSVSLEAYNWVMQSEPEYWANASFKGERYNHITLDIVESLDNWISEVRELPIIQKLDAIRCKMMELMYTRRVDSSKWSTKLTPSKEEKLQEATLRARQLKVLFSSDSIFEVHDGCINVVNIDQRQCSCQGWKITELPCYHAIAVCNASGRSPYDYCSRYFTTESFRSTYSQSINPIPDIAKPVSKESLDKVQVHPPHIHLRPGRPMRKRTRSEEVTRPLHCSKCKGEGHNRVTCKETS